MTSSVSGSNVTLRWTKSGLSGFVSYNVLRNGTKIGSTRHMVYNNKGVANGSYSYEVDAVDRNGSLLAQSNAINVTVNYVPKSAITNGAKLYSTYCSSCHKTLSSSTVMGKSASDIKSAIAANLGGMGSLNLTDAQVQAIGMTLTSGYTRTDCSSCHNGDGSLKESESSDSSSGSGSTTDY